MTHGPRNLREIHREAASDGRIGLGNHAHWDMIFEDLDRFHLGMRFAMKDLRRTVSLNVRRQQATCGYANRSAKKS